MTAISYTNPGSVQPRGRRFKSPSVSKYKVDKARDRIAEPRDNYDFIDEVTKLWDWGEADDDAKAPASKLEDKKCRK